MRRVRKFFFEGEGASVAWKINEMHEAWKKENGF